MRQSHFHGNGDCCGNRRNAKWKGEIMNKPITWKTYALAIFALALLVLALAIQGGAWGPSDLELFKRAAGL